MESLASMFQEHFLFLSVVVIFVLIVMVLKSIYSIGPTQVGLVRKRFGAALPEDNPIAFHGEAGYQADLLMPGLRFKFVLVYAVTKHPWVQVPAGQIGIVVAQIGQPLPIGAKSAVYTEAFGNFTDLRRVCGGSGPQEDQRPEGRPAAGPLAGNARAHSSRWLSWSSPNPRSMAFRYRRNFAAA